MDGIIIVDKPKDYTSRDVVNIITNLLKTKKIGHTGTLDPIATGVLVLCVGKALKIAELITSDTKEYIATLRLGIETDTLDITGRVLKEDHNVNVCKEDVIKVLNSFIGKIEQEVPKYSAVKVNGKKLYEYARENIEVDLPKRIVEIFELQLINYNIKDNIIDFDIRCKVSKGTYIRSLVRDIGKKLNTYATMIALRRIKQGNFSINDAYTLDDIKNNNYKILSISDALDMKKIIITDDLLKKVKDGAILDSFFSEDKAILLDKEGRQIAIYMNIENNKVKPWKVF